MIHKKLELIFTEEELRRLSIKENTCNKMRVYADVHGMKCYQARRFINNVINAIRRAFELIIIHGFNHGTAIKDMFANNYSNLHITQKYASRFNKGITHMSIL